jgi:hypothetical protein
MGNWIDAKTIVKTLAKHRESNDSEESPRRYSSNPKIQGFFEEHGDFVSHGNGYLFEDGAFIEVSSSGYGQTVEPPDDDWERSKLIETYWSIQAERDEDEFHQFKRYLHGTGTCPAHVVTDQQKLEYLHELKAKANRSRNKLRHAKKATKENQPAWLTAKEREQARTAKRKQEFLQHVDDVRL